MCLESADRDERSRHVIDLVRASAPGAGPRRCDGTRGGDARAWPCWVGAWGGAEAGHVGHGWANLRGPWHRVLVERSQCATALPSPTAGISPGKPLPAVGRPLPAPTAAAGSKTGAQKGFLSAHQKKLGSGRKKCFTAHQFRQFRCLALCQQCHVRSGCAPRPAAAGVRSGARAALQQNPVECV